MDTRLQRLADFFVARRSAAEVNPREIEAALLPYVYILDVESGPRLRVRLIGTALSAAFGRPVAGLYLEDFVHGPRASEVLAGFHECAEKHEKIWMRQVVRISERAPRFVEGVAIPLDPSRIYGGLLVGESIELSDASAFERKSL